MSLRDKIEAVYRKRHRTVGDKLEALECLFNNEINSSVFNEKLEFMARVLNTVARIEGRTSQTYRKLETVTHIVFDKKGKEGV